MKLIEAIKLKGKPVVLPPGSRDELAELFQELGFNVGVEIGVLKGKFSRTLCLQGLQLYSVDPWRVCDDFYDEIVPYPGMDKGIDVKHLDEHLEWVYGRATHILSRFPKSTIIRKPSMEAVKNFDNESLDFVYIDGNHHFKYVVEDIWEWSKKVRKGGIVSGHDYINRTDTPCHVKYAVDAFTQVLGIENWYVFGEEKSPSWMWFRQ